MQYHTIFIHNASPFHHLQYFTSRESC